VAPYLRASASATDDFPAQGLPPIQTTRSSGTPPLSGPLSVVAGTIEAVTAGDDALFSLDLVSPGRPQLDLSAELDRTGGVPVAVDHAFSSLERIQLDDASWVDHVHGWLGGDEALMQLLIDEADWEQRSRWMYTRTVTEPRLTAEYPVIADAPHPVLHHVTAALADHYEQPFTRLWMNWYRDHSDGTGWHADRPADRLPEAVIPVLSLGATRRFLIRPAAGGSSTTITTRGGDLVVMGRRAQRDFQHSVPQQSTPAGPRVSLNFSVDTRDQ